MLPAHVAAEAATATPEVFSWSEMLVGAPVAVVVVVIALSAWLLLDRGKLVLGREYKSVKEDKERAEEEANELRKQLTEYRDRTEAEILPALIRTTDLMTRIAFREEERR